jgi:hypothetical protein
MRKRDWLALLNIVLTASSCTSAPPAPASTPVLVNINGYGKWSKATATTPDTFGFSTRAAEDVCPGVSPISPTTCPARYPDTAFIDFSIPTLTTFEVSSGTRVLTEVSQTATVGDYQYRKAALTDGSSGTTTWRVAASIPNAGRTWCPPTNFPLSIVGVSGSSKSAALPVSLVIGKCFSDTSPMFFSTGTTGTPAAGSPPPMTTGECPGGAFATAFNVCERCGTTGLPVEKTFWGCSLTDAQNKMGTPGCASTLRSGINCP